MNIVWEMAPAPAWLPSTSTDDQLYSEYQGCADIRAMSTSLPSTLQLLLLVSCPFFLLFTQVSSPWLTSVMFLLSRSCHHQSDQPWLSHLSPSAASSPFADSSPHLTKVFPLALSLPLLTFTPQTSSEWHPARLPHSLTNPYLSKPKIIRALTTSLKQSLGSLALKRALCSSGWATLGAMGRAFRELHSSMVSTAPWSSASFSQMSSIFILLLFHPPWNTGSSPSPWLSSFFTSPWVISSLASVISGTNSQLREHDSQVSVLSSTLLHPPPAARRFLIYTPEPQQKSPPKDLHQLTTPYHFHECYTHSPVTWSSNLVLIFDPYVSLNPTSSHFFSILSWPRKGLLSLSLSTLSSLQIRFHF